MHGSSSTVMIFITNRGSDRVGDKRDKGRRHIQTDGSIPAGKVQEFRIGEPGIDDIRVVVFHAISAEQSQLNYALNRRQALLQHVGDAVLPRVHN